MQRQSDEPDHFAVFQAGRPEIPARDIPDPADDAQVHGAVADDENVFSIRKQGIRHFPQEFTGT